MARTCLFVKVLVVAAAVANVAWCTETVPDWAASARESELSSSTSECECIFHDDTQGHITQGCENDRCNNCGRCSQHQFSPDGVNFYRYCSCTGNEQCSEHCPQYNRNAAKWHHPPCQLPSGTEVHIQCDIFSTMTDECRDDVCWCYFNVDAGCPTSAVRVGGAIALVVLLCTCCVCVCRKFCKCCKGDQAQAATASVQDPLLEQVPTSTDPIGNRYGSFMQQAGQPPIVANGQQQQVMQQHVPQQQQQFMQQQHHGEEQRIPPPTHQPTSQATLAAPSPGASPAVNPAVGAASTLAEFYATHKLEQFAQALAELSVGEPSDLVDVTDAELACAGLKPVHINRLRRQVPAADAPASQLAEGGVSRPASPNRAAAATRSRPASPLRLDGAE